MSEDLQSLLEKINRDGVEKADAEAAKIIAKAKADAEALLKSARDEAAKAKADAEQASADYAARAAETIRQAARDTVISVQEAVTKLLEKVLVQNVDAALANPATAAEIAAVAVKELTGPAEVITGAKLAAALKAQLAARTNITVVTDETMETGFSVKTEGGRVEHAFTGEVIADELAKRLRPDLAALMK